MRYFLFSFITLSFVLLQRIEISAQEFITENASVEFISEAPLNTFTGTSQNLNGLIDLKKNLLDFYLDLNTLKTGIGLRDRHMRDNYLETKDYPFAEFTGKMSEDIDLEIGEIKNVMAEGLFNIHGESNKITVPGTLKRLSQSEVELEASFIIKLSDYNIDIPKLVFYELAEEQQVNIKGILKLKP